MKTRLVATHTLIAIVIANYTTLVIANLLEMKIYAVVFVYLFSLICIYQFARKLKFGQRTISWDRPSVAIVGLTLLLLTIPRIAYVLEWVPGNEVHVIRDDFARLAELVSMTLSDSYPLRHPANGSYLLSFYYASFYPFATLKLLIPVLTLKDVIAAGNLLYHALVLVSVLELAHIYLQRPGSVRMLVFLFTLFSGLDWMTRPFDFTSIAEWWQQSAFHANTQISAFYTGMFFTIHHFVASYALVLSLLILFHCSGCGEKIRSLIGLSLVSAAFFASPFSFASFPFVVLGHGRELGRRLRSPFLPYIIVASLVPMFIFMGRLPSQRFVVSTFRIVFTDQFWLDKVLSAPIYFTVVPLMEFVGIPFALLFVFRHLQPIEKRYYAGAVLFFVVTYVVAYAGSNQLSMRGMFLPSMIFFFLFAKYYDYMIPDRMWKPSVQQTAILALLLILCSQGTLRSFAAHIESALMNSRLTYLLLDRPVPEELQAGYRSIARDPQIRQYEPTWDRYERIKWNAEKLIEIDFSEMQYFEHELLRFPREGVFR